MKYDTYKLILFLALLFPIQAEAIDYNENYTNQFQTVWNIVNDKFVDKTFNHQDWKYWGNRYQNKINSTEDSRIAIESALSSLDDPYTFYYENYPGDRKVFFNLLPQAKDIYTKPVLKTKIPNNIQYIRITSFLDKKLSKKFYKKVKNSKKDGLIIDLRNNGGGKVKMALEIANMYLSDKNMVSLVNRESETKEYNANSITLDNIPIVILINQNSASASEILAAAMKENLRATIIGEKSYGKGVVQEVVALNNNKFLNVTVAKYLTPNRNFIHKVGVTPDIEIELTYEDYINNNDVQLKKAIEIILNK